MNYIKSLFLLALMAIGTTSCNKEHICICTASNDPMNTDTFSYTTTVQKEYTILPSAKVACEYDEVRQNAGRYYNMDCHLK